MVDTIKLVFNTTLAFFSGLVVFYVFFYFVKFWASLQEKGVAQKIQGSTFFILLKLIPSILIAIYVLFIGVMIYYTLKKGGGKKRGRRSPGRII